MVIDEHQAIKALIPKIKLSCTKGKGGTVLLIFSTTSLYNSIHFKIDRSNNVHVPSQNLALKKINFICVFKNYFKDFSFKILFFKFNFDKLKDKF